MNKPCFVIGILIILFAVLINAILIVRDVPKKSLKEYQSDLVDLYIVFKQVCKDYGVKHWATAGTFLGARREHGIIPWDDDIDIAMWKKDMALLLKNKDEIKKKYQITVNSDKRWNLVGGLKVQNVGEKSANQAFLDVQAMRVDGDKTIYDNPIFQNMYKKCFHSVNLQKTKFKDVKFEKATIPIPKSDSYLNNCYGPNWRVPKKRYSHYYFIDGKMPLVMTINLVIMAIGVFIGLIFIVMSFYGSNIYDFFLKRMS